MKTPEKEQDEEETGVEEAVNRALPSEVHEEEPWNHKADYYRDDTDE